MKRSTECNGLRFGGTMPCEHTSILSSSRLGNSWNALYLSFLISQMKIIRGWPRVKLSIKWIAICRAFVIVPTIHDVLWLSYTEKLNPAANTNWFVFLGGSVELLILGTFFPPQAAGMDTDPIQVLPEDFSNGFKGMMVGSSPKGKVLSYKSWQRPCDLLCHKLIRSKRDESSPEGRRDKRWRLLSRTPVPDSFVSKLAIPMFFLQFLNNSNHLILCCFLSPDANFQSMTSKWPAVWVKISSSWVCLLLYVWTLVAPLVLTNRDFSWSWVPRTPLKFIKVSFAESSLTVYFRFN